MEGNDFTWKTIFSNWFENAQDDESIMRYVELSIMAKNRDMIFNVRSEKIMSDEYISML